VRTVARIPKMTLLIASGVQGFPPVGRERSDREIERFIFVEFIDYIDPVWVVDQM
jgi:hypothetical protein